MCTMLLFSNNDDDFVVGNLDSLAYQCLLKNELLGAGIVDLKSNQAELNSAAASTATNSSLPQSRKVLFPKEGNSLFQVVC